MGRFKCWNIRLTNVPTFSLSEVTIEKREPIQKKELSTENTERNALNLCNRFHITVTSEVITFVTRSHPRDQFGLWNSNRNKKVCLKQEETYRGRDVYLRDEEPRIYARASSNTYNWQFTPLRVGGSVSRLDLSFFGKFNFFRDLSNMVGHKGGKTSTMKTIWFVLTKFNPLQPRPVLSKCPKSLFNVSELSFLLRN